MSMGSLEAPHPRLSVRLFGQSRGERTLLDAYRSGRLHHGLLLHGPRGVGKATLAYRMARFLLRYPDPQSPAVRHAEDFFVSADEPVFRQVASGAHPDLLVLEPAGESKTETIPIDSVRRLTHFFGSTAGAGGWRVAIIDPAEGLNTAAANALLKTLEEPPPLSLIVLVSHAPGRLPVTIRSRAARLMLAPLGAESLSSIVNGNRSSGADPLAGLSEGSVARYLALRDGAGLELHTRLDTALGRLPQLDLEEVHALLDGLSGREGRAAFRVLSELLLAWLEAGIRETVKSKAAESAQSPRHLPGKLARWVELWEKTARSIALCETLNLDRKQALLPAFVEMVDIARD